MKFSIYLNRHVFVMQTKTNTYESVDPDETAYNELSHQELHCLSFGSSFGRISLFATMDESKIQKWKSPL